MGHHDRTIAPSHLQQFLYRKSQRLPSYKIHFGIKEGKRGELIISNQVKLRNYLLWDMRPPGPRAESKRVTETPFLARVDAHTAPDTAQKMKFHIESKSEKH